MSEFTNGLITQYLGRRPDMWKEYLKNSAFYHQTELLRRMLETTERAMEREAIPPEVRERVLATVVFGDGDGEYEQARVAAQDVKRLLALADLGPSEGVRQRDRLRAYEQTLPSTAPVRPGEETR